jgi:hypothetical protein
MAIEILAWIEGIAKIAPALLKVLDTISTLGRKWRVRGSEFEQLKTDIEDVLDKMDYVANIGGLLEKYIKYYLDSYVIYITSDKLIEAVNRYYTDLSDKKRQFYGSSWEVLERQFEGIKKVKGMYINVLLQRVNYLDSKDAEQINIYVIEFNKKYDKANTYLRDKNVIEFKKYILDMSEQALDIHNIFKDSIADMEDSLKRIRR